MLLQSQLKNCCVCVEWWFSTEGKAFKEIIVSSCKILCEVWSKSLKLNHIKVIIILL